MKTHLEVYLFYLLDSKEVYIGYSCFPHKVVSIIILWSDPMCIKSLGIAHYRSSSLFIALKDSSFDKGQE